jgi:hypothetical protein
VAGIIIVSIFSQAPIAAGAAVGPVVHIDKNLNMHYKMVVTPIQKCTLGRRKRSGVFLLVAAMCFASGLLSELLKYTVNYGRIRWSWCQTRPKPMRGFENVEEFAQDAGSERRFVDRERSIHNAGCNGSERRSDVGGTVDRGKVVERERAPFARRRNAINNPLSGCNVAATCSAHDGSKRVFCAFLQEFVDLGGDTTSRAAGLARIADGEPAIAIAPLKRWRRWRR